MPGKEHYHPSESQIANHEFLPQIDSSPLLANRKDLEILSEKWQIPQEDILLIALNASGIKFANVENDRGRFVATFQSGRKYLLALTVTNTPFSPFEYVDGEIFFDGELIATASPMEKDTCTTSYWRENKKQLTLNSNSRSNCKGCKFCGTWLESLRSH